jgi:hypothetical protein
MTGAGISAAMLGHARVTGLADITYIRADGTGACRVGRAAVRRLHLRAGAQRHRRPGRHVAGRDDGAAPQRPGCRLDRVPVLPGNQSGRSSWPPGKATSTKAGGPHLPQSRRRPDPGRHHAPHAIPVLNPLLDAGLPPGASPNRLDRSRHTCRGGAADDRPVQAACPSTAKRGTNQARSARRAPSLNPRLHRVRGRERRRTGRGRCTQRPRLSERRPERSGVACEPAVSYGALAKLRPTWWRHSRSGIGELVRVTVMLIGIARSVLTERCGKIARWRCR